MSAAAASARAIACAVDLDLADDLADQAVHRLGKQKGEGICGFRLKQLDRLGKLDDDVPLLRKFDFRRFPALVETFGKA
jgi:hypothetical protein